MKRLVTGLATLALLLSFFVTAQAATQIREAAVWYRVHFGSGSGQPVTLEDVTNFIDTYVTERFPEGFTITQASGQWSSTEYGLIKEKTMVVDIQCTDTPANFTKIREIADAYTKRFAKAKASCFIKRIPGINTILYYQ